MDYYKINCTVRFMETSHLFMWKLVKTFITLYLLAGSMQSVSTYAIYTRNYDSFVWPDYTVSMTGPAEITNTTNMFPYLYMEDWGTNTLGINWNVSLASQVWVSISKKTLIPVRLDSGIKLNMLINETVSSGNPSLTALFFEYESETVTGKITTHVEVYYQCQLYCTGWATNVTISGVQFNHQPPANTAAVPVTHVLRRQATAGLTNSWVVDLMEIGRLMVNISALNPWDRLKSIGLGLMLFQAGSYNISVGNIVPTAIQFQTSFSQSLGCGLVGNENNLTPSLDYSNLTIMGTTMSSAIFDFRVLEQGIPTSAPKIYQHYSVGYYNNTWATPPGSNGLPLSIFSQAQIMSTFSFSILSMRDQSSISVCITIQIRNDYTSNRTFGWMSNNYIDEVRVCPWISDSSVMMLSGSFKRNLYYSGKAYSLYRLDEPNDRGVRRVHSFFAMNPSMSITDLDVFALVRYLTESGASSGYVSAISTGFRCYWGQGQFQMSQVTHSIINSTDLMNVTILDSYLRCILMEFSPESNTCEPMYQVLQTVNFIASTPALSMIMRFSPFIVLLDELSYYSYHETPYDKGFKSLADWTWNITNSKWVPSFVDSGYQQIQLAITTAAELHHSRYANNPPRFQSKNQNVFFITQTVDYWVWTAPLWALAFIILNSALKLNCIARSRTLAFIFRPLRSPGQFLIALFSDNIVYFSFRCFTQISFVAPDPSNLAKSLFNIMFNYAVLWSVVISGTVLPMGCYLWDPNFQFEAFWRKVPSCMLLAALQLIRIFAGWLHSLQSVAVIRLTALTILIATEMLIIYLCSKLIKSIRQYRFLMAGRAFRLLLHCILMFELTAQSDDTSNNTATSNMTSFCVVLPVGVFFAEYFIEFVIGVKKLIRFACQPPKVMFQSQPTPKKKKKIIKAIFQTAPTKCQDKQNCACPTIVEMEPLGIESSAGVDRPCKTTKQFHSRNKIQPSKSRHLFKKSVCVTFDM